MKLLIDTEWATFIADLPEEKQLEFFWAIFDYGKKDCSLKCWEKIQPVLEKGKIGYFNKLNNLKQYKNDNTTESVSEPITESVSESVSEREYKYNNNINNNNTRNSNKGGMGGKEKGGFVPPTLEEVLEYARQQNSFAGVGGFACTDEQATDFFNQYDRQGWLLGNGIHMANWRSGLMKWAQNKRQPQPTNRPPILNLTARERQDLINKEKTQALLKQLKAQGN